MMLVSVVVVAVVIVTIVMVVIDNSGDNNDYDNGCNKGYSGNNEDDHDSGSWW